MAKQIKGKSGTTYIVEGRPRGRKKFSKKHSKMYTPRLPAFSDPREKRAELAKRLYRLAQEMEDLAVPSPERGYYMDHRDEFRPIAHRSIKDLEAIERYLDKLPALMEKAKD